MSPIKGEAPYQTAKTSSPAPQFTNLGEFYQAAFNKKGWNKPTPSKVCRLVGNELRIGNLQQAWAKLEELWGK